MLDKLKKLFGVAVKVAAKVPGLRKLEGLLDKTKKQTKTLQWFWKQIDDVAEWLIDVCVGEMIDSLAEEIADNNPGVSYSTARAGWKKML